MEAKIKNGELVIKLPLDIPRYSAGGKILIIASTHGAKSTTARFRGKDVSISVKAFVHRVPAPKEVTGPTLEEMEAMFRETFGPSEATTSRRTKHHR